jgi:hypothetical protein
MKPQTTISILTLAALALTSTSALAGRNGQGGAKQMDQARVERAQKSVDRGDRLRSRDRVTDPSQARDQIRKKDQVKKADKAGLGQKNIDGGQLMSVQERNQYREQLKLTENNPEARTKLQAEHKEKMQQRAKAKGVNPGDSTDGESSN